MEVNMIILYKNSDNSYKIGLKKDIKNMINRLFYEVTEDIILWRQKDSINEIKYLISSSDGKMICLKLQCTEPEMKAASILDDVVNIIIKGKHRNKYNIIMTYDEVSLLYCSKLMPYFGAFERRLRELVYLTIVKSFGISWYEKSFNEHLKKELKRTKLSPSKLIENALDELTYEQMKRYLFEPAYIVEPECVIEEFLENNRIELLEKEDIISRIKLCQKKSLWERFFGDLMEFENLKNDVDFLQKKRNIVMHHKRITRDEFIEIRQKLKEVNKNLEKSIMLLENKIYTEENLSDVVMACQNMIKNLMPDFDMVKRSTMRALKALVYAAYESKDVVLKMEKSSDTNNEEIQEYKDNYRNKRDRYIDYSMKLTDDIDIVIETK